MNNIASIGQYLINFQHNLNSLSKSISTLQTEVEQLRKEFNDNGTPSTSNPVNDDGIKGNVEEFVSTLKAEIEGTLSKCEKATKNQIDSLSVRLEKLEAMHTTMESIFSALPVPLGPIDNVNESILEETQEPAITNAPETKTKKKLTKKKAATPEGVCEA
jgi:archaellum component FlaC